MFVEHILQVDRIMFSILIGRACGIVCLYSCERHCVSHLCFMRMGTCIHTVVKYSCSEVRAQLNPLLQAAEQKRRQQAKIEAAEVSHHASHASFASETRDDRIHLATTSQMQCYYTHQPVSPYA